VNAQHRSRVEWPRVIWALVVLLVLLALILLGLDALAALFGWFARAVW
jgi:hypothetical protein